MLEKLLPTFIRTLPKFKGLTKKDSREYLLSGSAMYLSETGGVYYAHNGYYNLYLNCPNLNENFFEGTPSDILTVVSEAKKNKTELSDEIDWAVDEGLLTPGSIRKHHAPLYTGDGPPEQIAPSIISDIIGLSEYLKLFVSKSDARPNLQGVCIHGGDSEYIGFSATNGFGLVNFRSAPSQHGATSISGDRILRIEPFIALKKAKVDTVLECLLYPSNFIQITCLIGDMIVTLEYNACINERFPPVDTIALIENQDGDYFEVDNRFLSCIGVPKRDFKGGYFSIPLVAPHDEDTYVLFHGNIARGEVHTAFIIPPTPRRLRGIERYFQSYVQDLTERVNHVDTVHSCMDSKVVGDMIRLIPKYFNINDIRVGVVDNKGNMSSTFLRFDVSLEDYDVHVVCAPSRVNVNYVIGELSNEEETEWRKVSL